MKNPKDGPIMRWLWRILSIIVILGAFFVIRNSTEEVQPNFQWKETDVTVIDHEAKAIYFRFMFEYNGWVELSALEELNYTYEVSFRDILYGDNQIDPCPYVIFTHNDGTIFDSRDYEDQTMCVRASDTLRRGHSSGNDYDLTSPYRLIGTNMVQPMLEHTGYSLYVNWINEPISVELARERMHQ